MQAQDRLFQIDLWRRASTGRLAEVLGGNFIGRDAMTRRIQYDGDIDAEWAAYGPDAKPIVTAFVNGINAWVALARAAPPEEFAAAGWLPEFWRPEDVLNRTDAFLSSGDARGDVFRARLVAAVGVTRANLLLGAGGSEPPFRVPASLDPAAVPFRLADAIRSIGTRPFLAGALSALHRTDALESPMLMGSASAITGERVAGGRPIVANDAHRLLETPSPFYLVHLHAPGWNVVGATPAWLPGVAMGHNEQVAWSMAPASADVQDVYVERLNPDNLHQVDVGGQWVNTRVVRGTLWLKGRPRPVDVEREYTPHGVSVATDPERHLGFALRWSGLEPGGAAGLGALAIDRARSAFDFRARLASWRMPAMEMVFADRDGHIGSQVAAYVPIRRGADGLLPVPAWTGANAWTGWRTLDDLPHTMDPRDGTLVATGGNTARTNRLRALLAPRVGTDRDAAVKTSNDVVAWNADQLVPLLRRLHDAREPVERARLALLAWDLRVEADRPASRLYVSWERALRRRLAAGRVGPSLVDDLAARIEGVFVPALLVPAPVWFDGNAVAARDRLLLDALASCVSDDPADPFPPVTFAHLLAASPGASARFSVAPLAVPGYEGTVRALERASGTEARGAAFRAVYDTAGWDRSVAQNAPGQSGSPSSPHFRDLAAPWSAGEYFPLAYTDAAVQANLESTLTLVPR